MLVALLLLCASSLHFEVLLTKLFANKLEHHYTFAILSIALLGFGAGGVIVHLRGSAETDTLAQVRRLWRYATAYALGLPVASVAFAVAPFDPGADGFTGAVALPIYFLLFATTFLPAGLFVATMLSLRSVRPGQVYAWDLVGAGLGATFGPVLLPVIGAWGSIAVASLLAMTGAVLLHMQLRERSARDIIVATGLLAAAIALLGVVPAALRSATGFDIVSFKYTELRDEFLAFGAPAQVYWNPIARVDVSPTGSSVIGGFRYGLARDLWQAPLTGRMLLVDGSANTRQWLFDHRPERDGLAGRTLWSVPYVIRPDTRRALVIGAGGGVDILVGKAMGATHIDAVELNPDIYHLLRGRPEDPGREPYTRFLASDDRTQVEVIHAEARHFARSRRPAAPYDVVLASGVDTLTAIQTSGNALSENFLYTRDAVQDYVRLLSPGGQLALTHWHLDDPDRGYGPTLPLKMLVTYLEVLEANGVAEPGKRVCVVSEGFWESTILKNGSSYTREEIDRLRAFARANRFQVVYDPYQTDDAPTIRPRDSLFRRIAQASREERERLLDELPWKLEPATDERPYFYWIRSNRREVHLSDAGGWIFPTSSVRWMFAVALVASLAMVAAPALRLRRGPALGGWLAALPFFAATGFAFILAQNALFLMLTLFVGGPLWSISVVLPSMLVGYGAGSWLAGRLVPKRRAGAWLLAAAFLVGFGVMSAASSRLVPSWIGQPTTLRMVVAVAMVLPFGALLGTAVPWFMEAMRENEGRPSGLAWMWSVSSAANVIGSLMFVPVCAQLGLRWTFALSAGLYVVALVWASRLAGQRPARLP